MAFISRIIRLPQLRHCATYASNITSKSVSALPQSSLINDNSWVWQQNHKIESPLIKRIEIDLPNGLKYVPLIDNHEPTSFELPTTSDAPERKEALNMLVIRRKKMKKHKLKKLRKRTKFERAKLRLRRKTKREKEFQAELSQQCKQGESFSADEYVKNKLAKLHEIRENVTLLSKRKFY